MEVTVHCDNWVNSGSSSTNHVVKQTAINIA